MKLTNMFLIVLLLKSRQNLLITTIFTTEIYLEKYKIQTKNFYTLLYTFQMVHHENKTPSTTAHQRSAVSKRGSINIGKI